MFAICIFTISLFVQPVFAEGQGNGTGGGKAEPLKLISSSIEDDSTNISLNPTIQLDFSKNICNIKVYEINKDAIHLTSVHGKTIPIKVSFPDDQVQRKYKEQIFISPKSPLEKNTQYRLNIDRTLKSKNGDLIDNAYNILFTTGTNSTLEENPLLKSLGTSIITFEGSSPENEYSRVLTKDQLLYEEEDKPLSFFIYSIVGICLLVVISLVTFLIYRKKLVKKSNKS